jgi:hypothetical protein
MKIYQLKHLDPKYEGRKYVSIITVYAKPLLLELQNKTHAIAYSEGDVEIAQLYCQKIGIPVTKIEVKNKRELKCKILTEKIMRGSTYKK